VGGSGKLLDAMLGKAGIKRSELTVINCIQCQPRENVFPTDDPTLPASDAYAAVQHCFKAHVLPVLQERPWKRIDLLGDKALRLIAEKEGGINRWRGSPLAVPALGGKKPLALPTLHPAYLMRDQALIPVVVNDLKKSLEVPAENYNLFPTLEEVKAFTATEFCFDIETSYTNHDDIKVVGLSCKPTEVIVVPFRGAYIDELRRIFKNAKVLIGQNIIQFDIPILKKALSL
jgi:uracil-DNA glycosylase family 4